MTDKGGGDRKKNRREFLKVTGISAGSLLVPSTVATASSSGTDSADLKTSFNPDKTKQVHEFANNLSAIESKETQYEIYNELTEAQQNAVNDALKVDKVILKTETDGDLSTTALPVTARHTVEGQTLSGGTAYTYTNVSEWVIRDGNSLVYNPSVHDDYTAPAFGWSFVETVEANIPTRKDTYFYSYVEGHFSYLNGTDEAYPYVKVVGDGTGSSGVIESSRG